MNRDENLQKALDADGLQMAENITGGSYKEDKAVEGLGLALHIQNSERRKKMLKERGDSQFSNTVEDYLKITKEIGFEVVMKDSVVDEEGEIVYLYVLWNKEYSVMISFDTFKWDHNDYYNVNSGKMYYNWRPSEVEERFRYTSSGGFEELNTWVGDHDCREAIKHNFNNLKENGELLTKWIKRPFMWLLTYSESKVEGYDYNVINEERIARLPKEIINAITPQ